jgi:hypothetical protein
VKNEDSSNFSTPWFCDYRHENGGNSKESALDIDFADLGVYIQLHKQSLGMN